MAGTGTALVLLGYVIRACSLRRTRATLVGVTGSRREPGPAPDPERPGAPGAAAATVAAWRVVTPLVVLVSGGLFVVSAQSTARAPTCARAATPTWPRWSRTEADELRRPPRPGRRAHRRGRGADRRGRRRRGAAAASAEVERARGTRPAWPSRPAPGVTRRALRRPERGRRRRASSDPNLLVVHQQDIQAVVNAMWKGGADARSPSRASGSSPPPASSATATPCSSRACPTPSPT